MNLTLFKITTRPCASHRDHWYLAFSCYRHPYLLFTGMRQTSLSLCFFSPTALMIYSPFTSCLTPFFLFTSADLARWTCSLRPRPVESKSLKLYDKLAIDYQSQSGVLTISCNLYQAADPCTTGQHRSGMEKY